MTNNSRFGQMLIGPRGGVANRKVRRSTRLIDQARRRCEWHRLPMPLGVARLWLIRESLYRNNLFEVAHEPVPEPERPATLYTRTADGSWNDLANPAAGMAGMPFGRNVLNESTRRSDESVLDPNPRVISEELLARDAMVPVATGNALIAAWIQFMIHDWFSHGRGEMKDSWKVPPGAKDAKAVPIEVSRIDPLPTAQGVTARGDSATPLAYANTLTHWWDGSQIYGTNDQQLAALRRKDNGRLKLGEVPIDIPDLVKEGTSEPGFWLGLGMMEILFAREHNSICDMLAEKRPKLDAEKRFQTARLINTALIAKIHTTEWTPMVTARPAAVFGLRANWYGLAGKRIHRFRNQLRGRGPFGPHAFSSPTLFGIPGSRRNDHRVPFALTEEFSAVYRMHQLVPDVFNFRSAQDNSETLGNTEFGSLTGQLGLNVLKENDLDDLLYTFGTTNPGLVTLHNFPQGLRTLKRTVDKDGHPREIEVDLATIDILRCRELGVPRYTEFRRLLGLKVPQSFEDVTSNSAWVKELKTVYGDDLDSVDLLTGMYAEDLLEGFAFSETTFRIFILMASRRISSDRFLTDDYTAKCYTHEGLAWIDNTTMLDVLQRHCPTLRPHLSKVDNAFMSWNPDANSH